MPLAARDAARGARPGTRRRVSAYALERAARAGARRSGGYGSGARLLRPALRARQLVRGLKRGADTRGLLFGIAIACCIAGYTLVDKEGIRHASLLPYLELVLAGPAAVYLASVLAAKGASKVRAEIRPVNAAAAVAGFGTYALMPAALRLAPAAPVAAVRETSVVIATVLAAVVLRERVTRLRLAGSILVVGGIALLALA